MSTHELAGKDTLPRGAIVFCTCGGAFYAPFAQINISGTVRPGDVEAAMREADRRFDGHRMSDVTRLARINPQFKHQASGTPSGGQ